MRTHEEHVLVAGFGSLNADLSRFVLKVIESDCTGTRWPHTAKDEAAIGRAERRWLRQDHPWPGVRQGAMVNRPTFTPDRQHAYDQETLEVRGRAAEVLAAIGREKLRTVALFRACRWADLSAANYGHSPELADLAWIRGAEWLRIWLSLSNNNSTP